MPRLYSGSSSDFLAEAQQNRIAETLRGAFFAYYGFEPPESELRFWRNSLRALEGAIRLGDFADHGLVLEYHLRLTSKRLDAMITGRSFERDPAAVIVELKQWDHAEPPSVPECVGIRYGVRVRDVLHPSEQAGQYRQCLRDTHTRLPTGRPAALRLRLPPRLHPRRGIRAPLSERHAYLLAVYPLFAGDRVDDVVQYLDDRIGAGRGLPVLRKAPLPGRADTEPGDSSSQRAARMIAPGGPPPSHSEMAVT